MPHLDSANVPVGVKTYRDGGWGVVKSVVVNPSPEQAQALLAVTATDDLAVQFCNRVWLPANSRRTILTPIRVPVLPSGASQIRLETKLVHTLAGREKAEPPESGMVLRKDGGFNSALLVEHGDQNAADLITALRTSARQGTSNAILAPGDMPATVSGYDALDALFVCAADPDLNPAQMDALRQWLLRGGRLWIMLDSTGGDWPSVLLGEDWAVAVIDRVGLSEVKFEAHPDEVCQFDYPVNFLRVLAPDFERSHHVGGYPAVLSKPIGRGELVVTVLAPQAWLKPDGGASQALQRLNRFVRPDPQRTDDHVRHMQAFDGYTRTMIAYSILGLGPVVGTLGVFTLLIAASAGWFARKSRLEYVAVSAVVLAVFASVTIVVMGMKQQSATPTSVVTAQLVRLDVHQPYAQVDSVMGVFTSPTDSGSNAQVHLGGGGTVWPELPGHGPGGIRLVWSDPEHAVFENLPMPSGAVRRLAVRQFLPVHETPKFIMSFNERGITGRLIHLPKTELMDPLIVSATGVITPKIDPDGGISAGLDAVRVAGQFMDASLIDRNRAGREVVYRQLLGNRNPAMDPALYLWQSRSVGGAEYTADVYKHAESLLVIPIAIDRPPSGSRVCVPAPIMKMSPFRGEIEGTLIPSTIYNSETGQWYTGLSEPMLVLMRFTVPQKIAPVRIESARISFDLRAPGRDYQIATLHGHSVRLARGGSNPLGTMDVDLAGADLPQQQPDGSVVVGLYVGPFTDPQASRGWALDDMSLSVTGVVE